MDRTLKLSVGWQTLWHSGRHYDTLFHFLKCFYAYCLYRKGFQVTLYCIVTSVIKFERTTLATEFVWVCTWWWVDHSCAKLYVNYIKTV